MEITLKQHNYTDFYFLNQVYADALISVSHAGIRKIKTYVYFCCDALYFLHLIIRSLV